MPKMKSNSGAAKRFRKTASGRFKSKQSHLRHILTKKSTKRKRHLRGKKLVHASDTKRYPTHVTLRLRQETRTMARVKRGVVARARHKKVLKQAKGYYGARSHVYIA